MSELDVRKLAVDFGGQMEFGFEGYKIHDEGGGHLWFDCMVSVNVPKIVVNRKTGEEHIKMQEVGFITWSPLYRMFGSVTKCHDIMKIHGAGFFAVFCGYGMPDIKPTEKQKGIVVMGPDGFRWAGVKPEIVVVSATQFTSYPGAVIRIVKDNTEICTGALTQEELYHFSQVCKRKNFKFEIDDKFRRCMTFKEVK